MPRLVCDYNQIRQIPEGEFFAMDTGWAETMAGKNAPYKICRKVGQYAMDFVVLDEADTAASAKNKLRKLADGNGT